MFDAATINCLITAKRFLYLVLRPSSIPLGIISCINVKIEKFKMTNRNSNTLISTFTKIEQHFHLVPFGSVDADFHCQSSG